MLNFKHSDRREFFAATALAAAGLTTGNLRILAQGATGSRFLDNFPTMTQPDDISCGPTSAAMVLKWYGIQAGIERCKTKSGTRWFEAGNTKVGMTLPSGVADCLNSFGLPSRVVSGSIDSIMQYIDQKRPPILLVRSGVKTWHWLVAIGYSEGGAKIKLSDPSGRQWTINRGTLDAAWIFSADLEGSPTGGRRCDPCAGSGKLVSARIPCTNCAGTGKMISGFRVKKCGKCDGDGKINASGGNCLVCSGSGKSPDLYRKVVETAGVSGHTLVVPDRGYVQVVDIKYTIKNESGKVVRFEMYPSGKNYTLDIGKTFTGTSHQVDDKPPTMKLLDSGKVFKITAGNHKFWWMNDERRIGFDRSTD
jgi:hypothetical protein